MEASTLTRRTPDRLNSTRQIDPNEYSANASANRAKSLEYALAGCLYMLRRQKNIRILAIATAAVALLAFLLQLHALEVALLALTITIVWLAEFLNGAIEAAVNLASPDYHPMAKVAKDVAAASVLLTALASMLVGLLILGPPFAREFQRVFAGI